MQNTFLVFALDSIGKLGTCLGGGERECSQLVCVSLSTILNKMPRLFLDNMPTNVLPFSALQWSTSMHCLGLADTMC
jgi:hypothetical protein